MFVLGQIRDPVLKPMEKMSQLSTNERIARVERLIRNIDDFPKPGVAFK